MYIKGRHTRHVKDMSSHPGYKRKPTVAIKDDVYEKAKGKAAEKGLTLVDYVNDTILQSVEKEAFLKAYAPYIEKISAGDTIILRDNKIKKIVEVYLKDTKLHCSNDEGHDCIHVHYTLGLPEVGKLKKK
jgi:hypothetical protein